MAREENRMTTNLAKLTIAQYKNVMDAGERASDVVNVWLVGLGFDAVRDKFLAFKLADGSTDNVLYDSKRDAVRAQSDERLCAYFAFRNCAGGTNPREMAIFMQWHRDAYDAGHRLPDPDAVNGGPEALITARQGDYYRNKFRVLDHYHGRRKP
jgi:hypothetical protein